MQVDRYVKIILTVIALELLWIGVRDVAPPVSAQAPAPAAAAAPTAVVIRGIDIDGRTRVLRRRRTPITRRSIRAGSRCAGTVTVQAERSAAGRVGDLRAGAPAGE